MRQDVIERLLDRLQESLEDQEGALQAGATERLLQRLQRDEPVLSQLAALMDEGGDLRPPLADRLVRLWEKARALEAQAVASLADLRQSLMDSAAQRRSLAGYKSALTWPAQESPLLNQKR